MGWDQWWQEWALQGVRTSLGSDGYHSFQTKHLSSSKWNQLKRMVTKEGNGVLMKKSAKC
jgi:hypothetical protein